NILKSQLGIIDDLRNITSNPKINNSIDPKNNINNKINAQSEINNKNQISENVETKSDIQDQPVTFEQKINFIRQYLVTNILKDNNIERVDNSEIPINNIIEDNPDNSILEGLTINPKTQNKISSEPEKMSFNSLLNSILADPKSKDMIVETKSNVILFKNTFEEENILLRNPSSQKFGIVNLNKENRQDFIPSSNLTVVETLAGEPSLLVNNKILKIDDLVSKSLDNSEPIVNDNKVIFHDNLSGKNKITDLNKIKTENIINIPVNLDTKNKISNLLSNKPAFISKNVLSSAINNTVNLKTNENTYLVIPDKNNFKIVSYSDLINNSKNINSPLIIKNDDNSSKIIITNKKELYSCDINSQEFDNAPILNESVILSAQNQTKLIMPEKNNKYSVINLENNFSEINQPSIISHDGQEKILFNHDNKNVFININGIKNPILANNENIVVDNNMKNYLERLSNKNLFIDKEKSVNPSTGDNLDQILTHDIGVLQHPENNLTIEQKVNLVRQFLGDILNKDQVIDNNNLLENKDLSDQELKPTFGEVKPQSSNSENKVPFELLLKSILADPKAKNLIVEEVNDIG
ncbi:MAG: hypothetical protein H7263_06055, partial [Candidatus Sericytochromatia bacterium]|nr:hypothetical protein [Candidatus Sericytochromatia bacterium]